MRILCRLCSSPCEQVCTFGVLVVSLPLLSSFHMLQDIIQLDIDPSHVSPSTAPLLLLPVELLDLIASYVSIHPHTPRTVQSRYTAGVDQLLGRPSSQVRTAQLACDVSCCLTRRAFPPRARARIRSHVTCGARGPRRSAEATWPWRALCAQCRNCTRWSCRDPCGAVGRLNVTRQS